MKIRRINEQLKPCPFCGGKAVITSSTRRDVYDLLPDGKFRVGYVEMFMARCSKCGASSDYSSSLVKVAALWNARASQAIDEEANIAKHIRDELADILMRLEEIARCGPC